MAMRTASAVWNGSLQEGAGKMSLSSGAFEGNYSFGTRFEDAPGTNPEELIAAAHAGCYSMALSAELGRAGFAPEQVSTTAKVHLEKIDGKPTISRVELESEARVPEIDDARFQEIANGAKEGCPVSRLLAAAEISLDAKLGG